MNVDAPVIVIVEWSRFRGRRGKVTPTLPHILVLLEGETIPLRFGAGELAPASAKAHHGGAE